MQLGRAQKTAPPIAIKTRTPPIGLPSVTPFAYRPLKILNRITSLMNSKAFMETANSAQNTATRRHWAIAKSSGVLAQKYQARPNRIRGTNSSAANCNRRFKSTLLLYSNLEWHRGFKPDPAAEFTPRKNETSIPEGVRFHKSQLLINALAGN